MSTVSSATVTTELLAGIPRQNPQCTSLGRRNLTSEECFTGEQTTSHTKHASSPSRCQSHCSSPSHEADNDKEDDNDDDDTDNDSDFSFGVHNDDN